MTAVGRYLKNPPEASVTHVAVDATGTLTNSRATLRRCTVGPADHVERLEQVAAVAAQDDPAGHGDVSAAPAEFRRLPADRDLHASPARAPDDLIAANRPFGLVMIERHEAMGGTLCGNEARQMPKRPVRIRTKLIDVKTQTEQDPV